MSIRKKINDHFHVIATDGMTHITWSALKALRDDGKLIPGMFYRITDYVTVCNISGVRSAGHAFDIIVRADSTNVLNENATAALHSGDTYFADQKIESWKLKYCLDNDNTRFAWVDVTCKGVIYRMIDERENDLPYDFKNIQFKRYKVTKYLVSDAKHGIGVRNINNTFMSKTPALRWGLISMTTAEVAINDNGSTWYSDLATSVELTTSDAGRYYSQGSHRLFKLSDRTEKWFYTFSKFTSDSDEVTDASLLATVYNNKLNYGVLTSNKLNICNNVFIGTFQVNNNITSNNFTQNTIGSFSGNTITGAFTNNTIGDSFNFNITGQNFSNNTIGNAFTQNVIDCSFSTNTIDGNFMSNTIDKYFTNNVIGYYFDSNSVSNNAYYNIIGYNFKNNVIGKFANSNIVGNNCTKNTIGNDFNNNTIGNDFNKNTIGNDFNKNTIGNAFNNNTIGNDFSKNTISNNFSKNTIGNNTSNNTFNDNFFNNVIGNCTNYNSIGDNFNNNTIGNDFTSNIIGKYYKWNHFENGCQRLTFSVDGTSSTSVQKYNVLAGTESPSVAVAIDVDVTAGNKAPYNVKMSADGKSVVVEAA